MFYMLIAFNYCLKEQKNKIDNIFFIKKQRNILSGKSFHIAGSLQVILPCEWLIFIAI